MSHENKKKVLIIALDGFTWELGSKLIAGQIMPRLGQLVESGCHGNLQSVVPAETASAWTSFQTGCLPGKTGVFTFHTYDRKLDSVRLNSYSDIAVPTIWELAEKAGKTMVSLNLPLTSPPPKVNGVIIPGLLCPALSAETVHPSTAYDKYIAEREDYHIVNTDRAETVGEFVDHNIATEQSRCRVALELMNDVDWDVFCVQVQSSDTIQHRLWPVMETPRLDGEQSQKSDALRFYRSCDEIVGQLVDAAGPDTLVVIASDHGFTSLKYTFNINVWLRERGYLQLLYKYRFWAGARAARRMLGFLKPALRWLRQIKNPKKTQSYLDFINAHLRRMIDLNGTRAFALSSNAGLVYIRDKDQSKDAAAVRSIERKLTEQLNNEFGPDSPNYLIDEIVSGTKLYGRGRTNCRPNLVLRYRPGVWANIGVIGDKVVIKSSGRDETANLPGIHDSEGVFVLNGPEIRTDRRFNASIVDIVPTILAWLGIPIPRHLDGKVLEEAFLTRPEMSFQDIVTDACEAQGYTSEEQVQVEKKLADLGYL